jgi:hypothetical protein
VFASNEEEGWIATTFRLSITKRAKSGAYQSPSANVRRRNLFNIGHDWLIIDMKP